MQTKFSELTDSQWEFIKILLEGHRPRKHYLRVILNAILFIARTGLRWRNLDSKYPAWESVYSYFRKWTKSGLWDELLSRLVKHQRLSQGQTELPDCVATDSQSVKVGNFIPSNTVGIDANKKINGRKRHIAVDSSGYPLAVYVSPADISDGEGGLELLVQLDKCQPGLERIKADAP